MGTTSTFAIPYPASTDYVTDGATNMKAIADQVDGILTAQVANRNFLYNGAMAIAQRNTSVTGITTDGYYTVDRWYLQMGTAGTFTQAQTTDVPAGRGFGYSMKYTCTTANTSLSAGSYFTTTQRLEGVDLQSICKGTTNAKTLTLSFWVKSYQTGTFIAELLDVGNLRSVQKAYTVNASGTWEYKTLTFPADTTGTISNSTSRMLDVTFWLAAGSSFTSGTLQTTWGTFTNANRAVGQTNLASSTSNYWAITGTQLTVGSVDTPFQFKSYQQDLRECLRYFQRLAYTWYTVGQVVPTNQMVATIPLIVPMRTGSTSISTSGTFVALDAGGTGRGITVAWAFGNTTQLGLSCSGSFNLTNGDASLLFSSGSTYIDVLGAEL